MFIYYNKPCLDVCSSAYFRDILSNNEETFTFLNQFEKKKLVAGVYKTDFTESFDTVFNPRILKVETKGIF